MEADHQASYKKIAVTAGQAKKKRGGKGLTIDAPLAPLLPLPLAELTGERVAHWLETESKTRPRHTGNAFRMLRAFVSCAADTPAYRGLIPDDACSARSVRDRVPVPAARAEDSLQREHLPSWFKGVWQIPNPVASVYLQALLITGARRGELAALKWEDVDFGWKTMRIRDKVDGHRTIPLTPYLAELFQSLSRINETPPS